VDGFAYLASFMVEVKDRKPVRIAAESYTKHRVLDNGRIDVDYWRSAAAATMSLITQQLVPSSELTDRFARRRLDARHSWRPSEADVAALVSLLLKRGLPNRR